MRNFSVVLSLCNLITVGDICVDYGDYDEIGRGDLQSGVIREPRRDRREKEVSHAQVGMLSVML